MLREIALDTETTGFDPLAGHRIVEIGCVEMINGVASGKSFWTYLNPEREVPPDAAAVHGLTSEFLSDKPKFAEIVDEFLAFIGEDRLVIHNAAFDMGFINAELVRIKYAPLPATQARDTVTMARQKFPGSPANLDALCKRFGIDNSRRELHGALLDAQLLAEVYLELNGGRQQALLVEAEPTTEQQNMVVQGQQRVRPIRDHAPTPAEKAAHDAFVKTLPNALWQRHAEE